MKLIGNIIWIVFGGFVMCMEYLAAGVAMCLTIIGIPFGIQSFKLALFVLFPFGQKAVKRKSGSGFLNTLMNIIWFFVGGVWIALSHVLLGVLFAITIIGLPFAKQHFKLVGLALSPFGREIV